LVGVFLVRRGFASEKVKGGKLVQVRVDVDEDVVKNVRITGDFFLHPEEVLEEIEESLVGVGVFEQEETILERLKRVIKEREAILVGFSAEGLVRVFKEAVSSCLQSGE